MTDKPKPCPFCGNDDITVKKTWKSSFEQYEPSQPAAVGCTECGIAASVSAFEKDADAKALDRWNRRAEECLRCGGWTDSCCKLRKTRG